jgi:hypothetical protein
MDTDHELPSGTPAVPICKKSSASAMKRELPHRACVDEIVAPLARVPGKVLLTRFVTRVPGSALRAEESKEK